MTRLSLLTILLACGWYESAAAEYVVPQMGGGQVGQGAAPMKHADITFDGQNLNVQVDPTVDTPLLRALKEPYEFDPELAWSVLGTKAYNFQYGWNPGGFITLPAGSWIWIEQLEATPGLEVYQRPPATPSYAPIFGTAGSSLRWRWNGSMTHNVYAVQDPTLELYEAAYRVYIADDTTGEPLLGYGAAEVTFRFAATPNVLAGDYNGDGFVNAADYVVWRKELGTSVSLPGDTTPGTVDEADYTVWRENFGHTMNDGATGALAYSAVPEPATWLLIACALGLVALFRNQAHRAIGAHSGRRSRSRARCLACSNRLVNSGDSLFPSAAVDEAVVGSCRFS
jgi:hypothetical protein